MKKLLAGAAIIVGSLGVSVGTASASCPGSDPFHVVGCAISPPAPPPCTNIGCRHNWL